MAKTVKKVERVRVQPWVDKAVADRLDKLAAKLHWTRNEVAEWVLNQGVSNMDWLAKSLAAMIMSMGKGSEMESTDNKSEASGAA